MGSISCHCIHRGWSPLGVVSGAFVFQKKCQCHRGPDSLPAGSRALLLFRDHVEAKGVFQQLLFRSWGLGANLGWAQLLIDLTNDLVRPCHGETKRSRQNDLSVKRKMSSSGKATATPTNQRLLPLLRCQWGARKILKSANAMKHFDSPSFGI